MVRPRGVTLIAQNRKARHDYAIEDTIEAGIVLQGTEVKSLRAGRATITDGYATIDGSEVWLREIHIPEYTAGTWTNHEPRRKRKLLLHRDEIRKLGVKVNQGGYSLVPLRLYFSDGYAKVELGIGKGRRRYDKRQALAERDAARETARALGRQRKGRD